MIKLKDVSLIYSNSISSNTVLDKVSVEFPSRGLFSIIGESGSGKSTFLSLLGNYLQPTYGEISFDCDVKEIGFVFQDLHLIDHLNVIDNVTLPLILEGESSHSCKSKGEQALAKCGIIDLASRKIDSLSGGQKARVAFARGIVNSTKVILADEPTGSLDEENSEMIMQVLEELSKNILVILVTHNASLAKRHSSLVYKIERGKLVSLTKEDNLVSSSSYSKQKRINGSIKFKENIKLSFSFLKKRMVKFVSSLLFTALCLSLMLGLYSLSVKGQEEIINLGKNSYDYTLVNISEKKEYEIENKNMNLLKKISLTSLSKKKLQAFDSKMTFYPSLEYILPSYLEVKYRDSYFNSPVSISPCFPSKGRLKEGRLPLRWDEIVINNSIVEEKDVRLNSQLSLKTEALVKTKKEAEEASDIISLNFNFTVVGISKEMDVLSRKTIYYDYNLMKNYLYSFPLENASKLYDSDINLQKRFEELTYEDDVLTVFKTVAYSSDPLSLQSYLKEHFPLISLASVSLELTNSLNTMIDSLSKISSIFIILSFACSFLLELVVVETLLQEKKLEMALYLSFHISRKDFFRLGKGQVFITNVILLTMTALFTLLIIYLGNIILVKFGLTPFLTISSLFPIGILIPLVSYLFSYLSMYFPYKNIFSSELVFALKGE